jgi:LCP family protein required for cell wall assembly
LVLPILIIVCLGIAFIIAGGRTNLLILGLDSREPGSDLGRSDTIILSTFVPRQPYLGVLSIPRDLWVEIPGVGENRINTAHFFAEGEIPGSGPDAVVQTIRQNFGVDVDYYLRIRFDSFMDLVDFLGGIDVELPEAMSGYPAGTHHMNSEQALAFIRDRAGSDDFYRMQRSQIFVEALLKQLLAPSGWRQLPSVLPVLIEMVDTNLPITRWPSLGITLLRVGPDGIDNRIISREMTNPFTTSQGAQVLGPNWNIINPVLLEMFGQ